MAEIWLPGIKPITQEDLQTVARYTAIMHRPPPPEFVTRENPNAGKQGPLDLDSMIVQAVIKSIVECDHLHQRFDGLYHTVSDFIHDPSILVGNYADQLAVVKALYDPIERMFYPDCIRSSGWIHNPASGLIVDGESTPYFWIDYHNRLEILFDTTKPNTKLLFRGMDFEGNFPYLKATHQKENLFAKPLDLIIHLYAGIYLPVIGITEIYEVDFDKAALLDKEGTHEVNLEEKHRHRWTYLYPDDHSANGKPIPTIGEIMHQSVEETGVILPFTRE